MIPSRRLWHRSLPWGMRYSPAELVDRAWRLHIQWWVLRVVPRKIKYGVIVEAATRYNRGHPGERTASEMLRMMEAGAR